MLTRLHRLDTGKLIGSVRPGDTDRWDAILEMVSEEFHCWRADIDSLEQRDGEEFVTVNGQPVARLEHLFGWRAA